MGWYYQTVMYYLEHILAHLGHYEIHKNWM